MDVPEVEEPEWRRAARFVRQAVKSKDKIGR
jgi:hypothetical protein